MHFYPAYRADDVMKELAVRFFALLEAAYRVQAEEHIHAINNAALSMAAAEDRTRQIDQLTRTADGIMPGEGRDDYSAMAQLKSAFDGR